MMCNGDCFNCQYTDCINDEITESERKASADRDDFAHSLRLGYSLYKAQQKYNNSAKGQERLHKYNNSDKGKERLKKYTNSEKGRLNQLRKNERRKEQRRLAHGNLQVNC